MVCATDVTQIYRREIHEIVLRYVVRNQHARKSFTYDTYDIQSYLHQSQRLLILILFHKFSFSSNRR